MTTSLIVAADPNWVIGVNGDLPWRYPADMKRFKRLTMDGTVIMGHKTWESLPYPLKGRRCLVLTTSSSPTSRHPADSFEFMGSLDTAFLAAGSDQHGTNGDVWIAGGGAIYELALRTCLGDVEFVDLTVVPEVKIVPGDVVTRFPGELLAPFKFQSSETNEDDPQLTHKLYELPFPP
jgi:dihydrofolate reductase